jgi:hypothetical protein
MIPTDHLLRRINVFATAVLADLHVQLKAFYSDIGRPSIDPELTLGRLLLGFAGAFRVLNWLPWTWLTSPKLRPACW